MSQSIPSNRSAEIHQLLHDQLSLPAKNPRVAHWLFANKNSTFHPDTPILPSASFENAVAINIRHTYSPTNQTTSPIQNNNHFSPNCPINETIHLPNIIKHMAPELNIHSMCSGMDAAAVDLLFVPVALVDGIMLGYDFAMPVLSSSSNPQAQQMSPDLLLGRYAYDVTSKHMVVVLNGMSHLATGIITISWDAHNESRNRYFFTVPNEQYSFDYLPNKVIICLSNLEIRLGSTHFTSPIDSSDDSNSNSNSSESINVQTTQSATRNAAYPLSADQFDTSNLDNFIQKDVELLPDLLSASADFSFGAESLFPPTVQSNFPTSESVPVVDQIDTAIRSIAENADDNELRHKRPSQSTITKRTKSRFDDNSVFNMSSLMSCMDELNVRLTGQFFGPEMKQEVCNPFTGEVGAPAFGQCQAELKSAGKFQRECMQQRAAQQYYQVAFSLITEKWLPFPKKPCREENQVQSQHTQQMIPLQPMNMVPVAPSTPFAPCPNCQTQSNVMVNSQVRPPPTAIVPQMDEKAIKEAKLEAKRRRNRLSAARSNQKRKEEMEKKKKELQLLKETEKELRVVQEKLLSQNEFLKQQAATMQIR